MEGNIFRKSFFYICMLCANLLGLVAGMTLSWSSPILPKLEKVNDENPIGYKIIGSDASWIGSLVSLGAVFGPFIAAFAAEKFGRKWALIGIGIPFVATFLALAFAKELWLYLLARAIMGLSVGGTFTVLPMYIAEMSPDHLRGTMGGAMNVFIVSGIFLSYSIGPFISILWFNIFCAIVASIFVALFTMFMPDTPQWLISKSRGSEAKDVLLGLRSSDNVDNEYDAISNIVQENSGGTIKDLCTGGNVKALIIAVSLLAFQQFSGINIVLFYAQPIFEESGSSIRSDISPIIVGGVQVCASVITPLLADRTGRKFLLILSAAGMIIAEIPLGVYFYLRDDGSNVDNIGWLPIASLVVYITMYNCGFGALPWAVMAEVFPPNVKGIAVSVSASLCWLLGFLLTKFFNDVSKEIGIGGSFWLFSGCNVLAILFVLFYVPETKGKSQKEIQEMLSC